MAEQIEVVPINDEKIKEVASTPPGLSLEAPPLGPRANDAKEEKPEEPEEVNDIIEKVEEKTTNKRQTNSKLKEKATCPDCGKELTVHGLKYTHKRYCKGKQSSENGRCGAPTEEKGSAFLSPQKVELTAPPQSPMAQSPSGRCASQTPQEPPKLERQVSLKPSYFEPISENFEPTPAQMEAYFKNQRSARVQKKQMRYQNLVSSALPN